MQLPLDVVKAMDKLELSHREREVIVDFVDWRAVKDPSDALVSDWKISFSRRLNATKLTGVSLVGGTTLMDRLSLLPAKELVMQELFVGHVQPVLVVRRAFNKELLGVVVIKAPS
jgi:hypothetical protein